MVRSAQDAQKLRHVALEFGTTWRGTARDQERILDCRSG